jgi:pimeloyl-ACP methyl ester carboxylesterase
MEKSECHPFRSAILRDRFLKAYDRMAEDWPVPSETRMVETSYGKTFVRICGPIDAKPLVLLHGAGANSLMWISNVRLLSAHFRVYAIDDIYGMGRSIYTKTIKGSNDYVNWLNESFNALKLGNGINMMGLSYGGWLISRYALRFPERIDKIMLLAPAATVLHIRPGFYIRMLLMQLPFRFFTSSFFYWLFEDWARKAKNAAEANVDTIFLASRCFKSKRLPIPTVLNDNELKSIRMPALFLVGENEKIYSAHSAVRRLNSIAPQIKTEILPDAGHDLVFVQTEMVNRKALEFFKESPGRTGAN